MVNLFLDIAENNAERNLSMSMNDWKNEVETSLKLFHYEVLEGKGKISTEKARSETIWVIILKMMSIGESI